MTVKYFYIFAHSFSLCGISIHQRILKKMHRDFHKFLTAQPISTLIIIRNVSS